MAEIIIYTKSSCPYCDNAKALLQNKGLTYQEISIEHDEKLRDEMITKSGRRTVPQIFISGKSIGGFDDLYALQQSGQLDKLLKEGENRNG